MVLYLRTYTVKNISSETCIREPPLRQTLNSEGWCKSWLSHKGTCHVILLAKLHDMYLYKIATFPHQPLKSAQRWLSYTGFTVIPNIPGSVLNYSLPYTNNTLWHAYLPMYSDRQVWGISVDPDEMRRIIRVYTVCHSYTVCLVYFILKMPRTSSSYPHPTHKTHTYTSLPIAELFLIC